MNFAIRESDFGSTDFQLVERKGIGHPDTLIDTLAEKVSQEYSKYCLDNFGCVLHHNCDKFGIYGGRSKVDFGYSEIVDPIKIIINGRFSESFGGKKIPYREIIDRTIKDYLKDLFPLLDVEKDIEIHDFIHSNPSPGVLNSKDIENLPPRHSYFMFNPRDERDLTQSTYLESNDTSVGVSHAPYTTAEQIAMDIESFLNSPDFKKKNPFVGTDIKVMVVALKDSVDVTICIPFIGKWTPTLKFYKEKIIFLEEIIISIVKRVVDTEKINVSINNRDVIDLNEIYLTAIGSSIESGDEGLVGRGNRTNGTINFTHYMSLEAANGKNPIYHIGKVYSVLSQLIADEIFKREKTPVSVHLVSQTGHDLQDPWYCIVSVPDKSRLNEKVIENIVNEVLLNAPEISLNIINGQYRLV